jgi:hypothetical protein
VLIMKLAQGQIEKCAVVHDALAFLISHCRLSAPV